MSLDIQSSSVLNSPSAEAPSRSAGMAGTAVSDQDREQFAKLLDQGGQQNSGDLPKLGDQAKQQMPFNDLESGEGKTALQTATTDEEGNPMSSLFSQSGMSSFVSQLEGAPQAAKPEAAPRLDPQEVQQIADRILVSAPSGGNQEVRITPNQGLLPGTEIIVTRDNAGMLQVSVKTTDATAFQTLVGAQGDLKDALQTKESMPVRVVIASDEAGAGDNDSRRRSAGLFEQYGNEEG